MADPTLVQANCVFNSSSGSTLNSSSASTTTGNFIIAVLSRYGTGGTTNVSDTQGNTYTKAGSSQGADGSHLHEFWYTASPITGNASNVVTADYGASVGYRAVAFAEFSLAGATALGYVSEATLRITNSTNHDSNSLTTSNVDDLIIGWFTQWSTTGEISAGTNGLVAAESGASGVDDAAMGYRFTDAAGSYTVDLNTDISTQYVVTAKAFAFTVSTGVYRPSTDVQTTNWASTGANFFGVIDEVVIDDADYVTSPSITGSGQALICGLSGGALAAGTWSPVVKASVSSGTATLRIKLLNDSNSSQGQVDITVNTTPTRYDPTITTSGSATRISFEFFSS